MQTDKVKKFINFAKKDVNIPLLIAYSLIIALVSFFIIWFHHNKPTVIVLSILFSIIFYITVIIEKKRENSKTFSLVTNGMFYTCFCPMILLFIAGFYDKNLLFFLVEIMLLVISYFIMIMLCCVNIRKNKYDGNYKGISSGIITCGIVGYIVGSVFLKNIMVNVNLLVYFCIFCVLLLSFGSSYLFRFFLAKCIDNDKMMDFISWLEN